MTSNRKVEGTGRVFQRVILETLAAGRMTDTQMCDRLNCSPAAIYANVAPLVKAGTVLHVRGRGYWLPGREDPPHDQRKRERSCLCCRSSFLSEGPHHRMCADCRSRPTEQWL